ncbi:hypothetical protein ILUMI_02095 [Ignelater luminosus]|uniref:Uncharacterized protein n=1 Tax=Ignelater luminosus TaxID=2038154 RepID=A0A8K0GNI6_IGNLU|nr:hypothetical protein ILUMI_02095 [Ignelater luminosus]
MKWTLLLSATVCFLMLPYALSKPCFNKRGLRSFRGMGLTQIPPEIEDYDNCTVLDFGFNDIKDLTSIGFLNLSNKDHVTSVYMYNNRIEKLDYDFFANWPNAKTLDLKNNFIKKLDRGLCSMPKLKFLFLNGNNLMDILEDPLECLKNLKEVHLDFPPSKLPRSIFKGTSLSRLFVNCTEVKNWNEMNSTETARIILTIEEAFVTPECLVKQKVPTNRNSSSHEITVEQKVPMTTNFSSHEIIIKQEVPLETNLSTHKSTVKQEVPITANYSSPKTTIKQENPTTVTRSLNQENSNKNVTETADNETSQCDSIYAVAGIITVFIIGSVYVLYKKKYFSKFPKKRIWKDNKELDGEDEGLNPNTNGEKIFWKDNEELEKGLEEGSNLNTNKKH